jgi:hypothetical protein
MKRYAQLESGIVANIIESESDPDGINGRWVACDDHVGPGWLHDSKTGIFSEPPPDAILDTPALDNEKP